MDRCEHGAIFHLCPLHTLDELAAKVESSALLPCKNSLNGKHKFVDNIGKNAGKLDQCVLCNQLLIDLKRRDDWDEAKGGFKPFW